MTTTSRSTAISSASAQASIDTAPEGPSITKTVDVDATYLGGPVRYQVEITLPADSGPFFDLTVMDDLPDGLRFGDTVSADCTGCGTAPSVRSLDPSDSATGTRTGWSLGDLQRQAAPRRIVITYDASLAQTYADGSPIPLDTVFENTATLGVNTTDRLGDATPSTDAPPTFDLFDSASTPVRYGRPVLSLDKRLHSSENAASIIPDNDGVRREATEGMVTALVLRHLEPLSEADCPRMAPALRRAFLVAHEELGDAVSESLVAHQRRMRAVLGWPIAL